MLQKRIIFSILVLGSILICRADDTSTSTSTPSVPQKCSQVQGLSWNNTDYFTTWYEVGRYPNRTSPLGCVEVQFKLLNSSTLGIDVTYATNFNALYQNTTSNYNATLPAPTDNQMISVNVSQGTGPNAVTYFKILKPDNNFLFGCGYTNASDDSTAFGFVLSKSRSVNTTALMIANNQEALESTNFINGTLGFITQSDQCYVNSGVKNVPFLAILFAVAYALLK